MKAAGIGKTHSIEPIHSLLFGVAGRGEEPVHYLAIRVGRLIAYELVNLLRRGRQAAKIERHTADQRAAVGFRRGRKPGGREALRDEYVDGMRSADRQRRGALQRLVGPMPLVHRAFVNPLANGLLMGGGEFLVRLPGRHHGREVATKDPLNDETRLRVARHDRRVALAIWLDRFVANIQAQIGHAGVLVRAVAAEARVGHDGPDVAIEAHGRSARERGEENREHES